MTAFGGAYVGRTVLVTGHTGFKGAWLTWWLLGLGARVVGYSLPAATPGVFAATGLADAAGLVHLEGDVRDGAALAAAVADHRPEFVFHLAAQPLVRASYRTPVETFEVNVMGTAHLLEAVRRTDAVKACVVVTTDKCYENREWVHPYREADPLGGHDPYSASKAAAEIVAASYRASFFAQGAGIATARAGNVIGGGDWAEDRLVPDAIRALAEGDPLVVRHPEAVRPWQHVLDPLSGYLWLGARLAADPARFASGWNFGPSGPAATVGAVVARIAELWGPGAQWRHEPPAEPLHEAHTLKLDIAKAQAMLGWEPVMGLDEALEATLAWYRGAHAAPAFDAAAFTRAQIAAFEAAARERRSPWMQGADPAPTLA